MGRRKEQKDNCWLTLLGRFCKKRLRSCAAAALWTLPPLYFLHSFFSFFILFQQLPLLLTLISILRFVKDIKIINFSLLSFLFFYCTWNIFLSLLFYTLCSGISTINFTPVIYILPIGSIKVSSRNIYGLGHKGQTQFQGLYSPTSFTIATWLTNLSIFFRVLPVFIVQTPKHLQIIRGKLIA